MKKPVVFFVASIISLTAFYNIAVAQKNDQYNFEVDLRDVKDDKLKVTLYPPKIKSNELTYNIPKVVPGTYSISDFGRFVTKFTAYDKKGKKLSTKNIEKNSWLIKKAKKLYKITYTVEDTWDTKKGNVIFEPAGSNIEEGKNFAINTFAFFGYFDEMKTVPYEITFKRPGEFYGSTSLIAQQSTDSSDVFLVDSYMDLADAPIMYNEPDTTILEVGGADILVSVYSPNKLLTSKFVGDNVAEILEAQRKYLGGTLPIKKYAFIIYLTDKATQSGMIGALEHSYSSFYLLQELPEAYHDYLATSIKDIAAHEFFHIITPLSIHSEEIHDFDFIDPKMSKHLWLYEGCVEYFSGHVQVQYELIGLEDYLDIVKEKIRAASAYKDDLPFTEMSKDVLKKYKDEYGNVYEKGALIGLCLDVRLRKLSEGKYGLIDMMKDLSEEYGKNKPFKDEELFDKIVEITGLPEIREFFTKYVEGPAPLPLKETFEMVGFDYQDKAIIRDISLGNISLNADDSGNIFVNDIENMDEFGKEMGYEVGDIIRSINGDTLTIETAQDVIGKLQSGSSAGDTLSMVVERSVKAENKVVGETKKEKITLSAPLREIQREELNHFEAVENPTPEQLNLLKSWLVPSQE